MERVTLKLNEYEIFELLTFAPQHAVEKAIDDWYDKKDVESVIYYFLAPYNKMIVMSGADEEFAIRMSARYLIYYYPYEYNVLVEDAIDFSNKADEYHIPIDKEDIRILKKIVAYTKILLKQE